MLVQLFRSLFSWTGIFNQSWQSQNNEAAGRLSLFENDSMERSGRAFAPAPVAASTTVGALRRNDAWGVNRQRVAWFGSSSSRNEPRRAEQHLREQLTGMGRQVQKDRIYVVQIDRKNRSRSDLGRLNGRTYVFRGGANGRLTSLGSFTSSSQPTGTGERSQWAAARNRGVAHIRPGHYRVSRNLEETYGGAFRIGTTPAARDRNHNGVIDPSEERTRESATGILFHSSRVGSAGCQMIQDFNGFARAVGMGRGSTFDYFLVRD